MPDGYVVTKQETTDSGAMRTFVTLTDGTKLTVTTPRRQSTGPGIEQAIAAAIATRPTGERLQ